MSPADLAEVERIVTQVWWLGSASGFFAGMMLFADWSRIGCKVGIHDYDFHPDDQAHAYWRECWTCGKTHPGDVEARNASLGSLLVGPEPPK